MPLLNVYATRRELPALDFPHRLRAQRDREDRELGEHLRGFMGFVMDGGNREMNASRYAVLGHLERVRHHLAIEVEERHMAAFRAWATEANAIVFTTEAEVVDPAGRVLVDRSTGDAARGAELPHPADALARRKQTTTKLLSLGIRLPGSLPPVVSASEVALRTPDEIEARCFALLACAVRAEVLNEGLALGIEDILAPIARARDAFSPNESAFFGEASPDRQTIVDNGFRYESLWALAWAIGLVDELPEPTVLCDVPRLAEVVRAQHANRDERPATRRSTAEILDALDLHYRLNWATTDARVEGREPPADLEPGVVYERHYAFNWLTRFEDAAWDDVDTPT